MLLNESDVEKAYFPIEDRLRSYSKISNGKGYVVAVYDMCRVEAKFYKDLTERQEEVKEVEQNNENNVATN